MIGAVGILSVAGTFLYALMQKGGPQKIAERQSEVVRDAGKVTEPMTSSIRNFNPVVVNPSKSKVTARQVSLARVPDPGAIPNVPVTTSISIFAAEPQGERPLPRGPKGDYAPAFRLVKCQLVKHRRLKRSNDTDYWPGDRGPLLEREGNHKGKLGSARHRQR